MKKATILFSAFMVLVIVIGIYVFLNQEGAGNNQSITEKKIKDSLEINKKATQKSPLNESATEKAMRKIPDSLGNLDVRVAEARACNNNSTEIYANGQSLRVGGVGFADNTTVTIRISGSTDDDTHWSAGPFKSQADSTGTLDEIVTFSSGVTAPSYTFIEAFGNSSGNEQRILTTTMLVVFSATADADGDGVPDLCDNCGDLTNINQADSDSDGIGNACDAFPNDSDNDLDKDGISGDVDPCPFDPSNACN